MVPRDWTGRNKGHVDKEHRYPEVHLDLLREGGARNALSCDFGWKGTSNEDGV